MFRLCLAFGGEFIHPDYLEPVLTERQLAEWALFDEIEPIGGPGDDFRAALGAWAAVSPHMRGRSSKPDDFVPEWGGRDPLSPAEYLARAKAVYARASRK